MCKWIMADLTPKPSGLELNRLNPIIIEADKEVKEAYSKEPVPEYLFDDIFEYEIRYADC